MNIALDVMGGDHAPEAVIDGMLLALETLGNEDRILAIGPAKKTEALLAERGYQGNQIQIIAAEQVIEMGEHPTDRKSVV